LNTVYILGKKGFRYAVGKQLGKTCRACLPGELIDHDDDRECQLYWVPENLDLVEFKKKVTAFIIFKYRLRFFASADEYWTQRVIEKGGSLSSLDEEAGSNRFFKADLP
jgi:hypothetical protein